MMTMLNCLSVMFAHIYPQTVIFCIKKMVNALICGDDDYFIFGHLFFLICFLGPCDVLNVHMHAFLHRSLLITIPCCCFCCDVGNVLEDYSDLCRPCSLLAD